MVIGQRLETGGRDGDNEVTYSQARHDGSVIDNERDSIPRLVDVIRHDQTQHLN